VIRAELICDGEGCGASFGKITPKKGNCRKLRERAKKAGWKIRSTRDKRRGDYCPTCVEAKKDLMGVR